MSGYNKIPGQFDAGYGYKDRPDGLFGGHVAYEPGPWDIYIQVFSLICLAAIFISLHKYQQYAFERWEAEEAERKVKEAAAAAAKGGKAPAKAPDKKND